MERIEAGIFGRDLGKKDMVFAIIYAKETQPYLNYDHVEDKKMIMPTVLFQARWDGQLGFAGGNVDAEDANLKDALMRELKEEICFEADESKLIPFTTFANEKRHIHSFLYEVNQDELKKIFLNSFNAEHFGAENCGSIAMQIHEISVPNLLKQSWSGTACMEFQALINEILHIPINHK
jgi:ADP-ribose pyrophosphatase YjhB (NUDIX family)